MDNISTLKLFLIFHKHISTCSDILFPNSIEFLQSIQAYMHLLLEITAVESECRWKRSSKDLLVSTSKAGRYVTCECIRSGPSGHVDIHIFVYRYHVRF